MRHPDQVWFRYGLDPAEPWSVIQLTRRRGVPANIDDDEFLLYNAPRAIDPKKAKDLAQMRQWLAPEFHPLYPDPLPPAAPAPNGAGGDGDGAGEDEDQQLTDYDDEESSEVDEEEDADEHDGGAGEMDWD